MILVGIRWRRGGHALSLVLGLLGRLRVLAHQCLQDLQPFQDLDARWVKVGETDFGLNAGGPDLETE
jgi:hypothetical protein